MRGESLPTSSHNSTSPESFIVNVSINIINASIMLSRYFTEAVEFTQVHCAGVHWDEVIAVLVVTLTCFLIYRAWRDVERQRQENAMLGRVSILDTDNNKEEKYQRPYQKPIVLPAEQLQTFTADELWQYNGINNSNKGKEVSDTSEKPLIYIAVKGVVYDVTWESEKFYNPGCCYHCFAGRIATRGLAKIDLQCTDFRDDVGDLSAKQLAKLKEWIEKYEGKYQIVGRIGSDKQVTEKQKKQK
jgi:predicted heme/steroid binding protein